MLFVRLFEILLNSLDLKAKIGLYFLQPENSLDLKAKIGLYFLQPENRVI